MERHFITMHLKVNADLPQNSEVRKQKVKWFKQQLSSQQSMFTKVTDTKLLLLPLIKYCVKKKAI